MFAFVFGDGKRLMLGNKNTQTLSDYIYAGLH